jgi:hypothetical protein
VKTSALRGLLSALGDAWLVGPDPVQPVELDDALVVSRACPGFRTMSRARSCTTMILWRKLPDGSVRPVTGCAKHPTEISG